MPPASAGFTFTEVAPSLTSILSLRGGKEHDAEDAQFRDEAKRKDAGLDGSLANLKSLLDTLGERIKEKNQPAKLADDVLAILGPEGGDDRDEEDWRPPLPIGGAVAQQHGIIMMSTSINGVQVPFEVCLPSPHLLQRKLSKS